MRLTVHLSEVVKEKVEVETKGVISLKSKIFNTLSFKDVSRDEANRIISQLESQGKIIKKQSISGSKIPGMSFVRKKK